MFSKIAVFGLHTVFFVGFTVFFRFQAEIRLRTPVKSPQNANSRATGCTHGLGQPYKAVNNKQEWENYANITCCDSSNEVLELTTKKPCIIMRNSSKKVISRPEEYKFHKRYEFGHVQQTVA